MKENYLRLEDLRAQYSHPDVNLVEDRLKQALGKSTRKVIVLDDDPTGVQTVHNIYVYTDWTKESIESVFMNENRMFFILTNSRFYQAAGRNRIRQEIIPAVSSTGQFFS